MRVYVTEDIIRNGNTWVEEGTYEVLRRFDATRWIIVLKDEVASKQRIITLVPIGYSEFVYES